jgi:hypothetical protein
MNFPAVWTPLERGVRPLALLVACLLVGCGADAVSTAHTDNAQINVERLFDHDGCTVYRFQDGGDALLREVPRRQHAHGVERKLPVRQKHVPP